MSKTLCKNTSWEGRNVFIILFKLKMKTAYRCKSCKTPLSFHQEAALSF